MGSYSKLQVVNTIKICLTPLFDQGVVIQITTPWFDVQTEVNETGLLSFIKIDCLTEHWSKS